MQRGTPPPPRARSQYACPPLSCNLNLSKIPEPSATIRRKPDSTDTPNLQQPTRRYLATPPADSISIAFMFPDSCSECICSFLYLALVLLSEICRQYYSPNNHPVVFSSSSVCPGPLLCHHSSRSAASSSLISPSSPLAFALFAPVPAAVTVGQSNRRRSVSLCPLSAVTVSRLDDAIHHVPACST